MPGRWTRFRKIVIRGLTAVLVILGAFIGVRWTTGNQGVIRAERFYRSGQLSADGLRRTIERHGIRTVLNLRGSNPDEPWYRAERAATLQAGATQIDMALASDLWLSRDQARMLVDVLETAEKPVLLHCQWGAERTGLVAAVIELLGPGGSLRSARDEFALYYMFLPTNDGRMMTGHVDRYAEWLASTGQRHDPELFRHWLTVEYTPGTPSREQWPYDPYPLAVVTRPGRPSVSREPQLAEKDTERVGLQDQPADDAEASRRR